jgi:WhiB family transcriptional regulator, redox-sensing transcriptional regulator
MSLEEALRTVADALREAYVGYDVREAGQELEDRVISAEVSVVVNPHPVVQFASSGSRTMRSSQVAADGHDEMGDEQEETSITWHEDWVSLAACRNADRDMLSVQGAAQNRAKAVCMGCPVRTECLADALDNRVEFGVWGGMTERERRALLRRRPNVRSWRGLLASALAEYEKDLTKPARVQDAP